MGVFPYVKIQMAEWVTVGLCVRAAAIIDIYIYVILYEWNIITIVFNVIHSQMSFNDFAMTNYMMSKPVVSLSYGIRYHIHMVMWS